MDAFTLCAWVFEKTEEGIRSLETVVTVENMPLYGFWKPNLGSLDKKQVLLAAESSWEPLFFIF